MSLRYAEALRTLLPGAPDTDYAHLVRDGFERGSLIKNGVIGAVALRQHVPAEEHAAVVVVKKVEALEQTARRPVDAATLAIFHAE